MAAFPSGSTVGQNASWTSTDKKGDLGHRSAGSSNTEWIYVQASGAIRQYDIVAIDEDFTARAVTAAHAADAHLPGFAQVAFADDEYGWVALRGSDIKANVAASCAADVVLRVGTTGLSAGVADDAASATGSVTLQGVVAVEAGATATTGVEIIATNPIFAI